MSRREVVELEVVEPETIEEHGWRCAARERIVASQADRVREIEAMLDEAKTDLAQYRAASSLAAAALDDALIAAGFSVYDVPNVGRLERRSSVTTVKDDKVFLAWAREEDCVVESPPSQKALMDMGYKWMPSGSMRNPATKKVVRGIHHESTPRIVFVAYEAVA